MSDDAFEVIARVAAAGVLNPSLSTIASRGATASELEATESEIGRPLPKAYRTLLGRWNGLDLDVVRIFGCGAVEAGLTSLTEEQVDWPEVKGWIAIGSDPSGFIYFADKEGAILSYDTDGGDIEKCASDLDDFLGRLVFGSDAAQFCGEEWARELRKVGLGG